MTRSPSRGTISNLGEFEIIRLIQRSISQSSLPSPHGIGDDAALIKPHVNHEWLVSKDLLVEGIHFDTRLSSFLDIGYKAAAVNLSDIAAMGGTPLYLLLGLAIPSSTPTVNIRSLYRGLNAFCKKFGVKVIGGDTCASRTDICLSITIIGKIKARHALCRDGAKAGDRIYVSGTLGDSGAGLRLLQKKKNRNPGQLPQSVVRFLIMRHQRPTPRVELGQLLSKHQIASSAIDLSDGLSGDLHHICQASQVGASIDTPELPISRQCTSYMKYSRDSLMELVLNSGEDYELLFTVPPQKQLQLQKFTKSLGLQITPIGIIQHHKQKIYSKLADGSCIPMNRKSFDHFHQ